MTPSPLATSPSAPEATLPVYRNPRQDVIHWRAPPLRRSHAPTQLNETLPEETGPEPCGVNLHGTCIAPMPNETLS
jgi:hypothetical protein